MELIMKDILKMVKWKEKGHFIMDPADQLIKEVGLQISSMVLEFLLIKQHST